MPELLTPHCEEGRRQTVIHVRLRLHSALGLPVDQHLYLQGLRAPQVSLLPYCFSGCRSEKAGTWGVGPGPLPSLWLTLTPTGHRKALRGQSSGTRCRFEGPYKEVTLGVAVTRE